MEIAIYGGTVMMLAYDCRAATQDVDAIFHPAAVVEPLVVQVAQEIQLPDDWLNSGVKAFIAKREEGEAFAELQIPGLVITRPSAKFLLAMNAWRAVCLLPFVPVTWRI